MNNSELKYEIQKAIELVPDSVLEDILQYLQQLQANSADEIEFSRNLKRILLEDKELLEKLAR